MEITGLKQAGREEEEKEVRKEQQQQAGLKTQICKRLQTTSVISISRQLQHCGHQCHTDNHRREDVV